MNVLHVIGQLVPGGSEKMTLQVAAGMRARGHDHRIAVLDALDADFVHSVCADELPIYRLGASGRSTAAGARRLRALRSIARRQRADVVQGHAWRSSAAAGLVARSLGSAGAATLHRIYYPRVEARVDPLLQRLWRVVIVDSHAVADLLARHARIAPGRIAVIPNFVSSSLLSAPVSDARRDGPTRFLMAAHFTPVKGHRFAIEGLARLEQSRPGGAQLDLLGGGPLLEAAKRLAEDLGVAHAVFFHGPRSDLARWLQRCDVVVLPSLWEGFGVILAEAMASGRPAISFAIGGAPEVVVHGETGLLVPPGNVPALASAMERLSVDSALRSKMGRAGRERAQRLYSMERVLSMYERLYDRCAAVS